MGDTARLSKKTVAVLTLIAEGHSYGQIVDSHPGITYLDIFAAAEEALRLNETASDYHARVARIKSKYPRAYEKWTPEEDDKLAALQAEGGSIEDMAAQLQRQPSAIESRLGKLSLSRDDEM